MLRAKGLGVLPLSPTFRQFFHFHKKFSGLKILQTPIGTFTTTADDDVTTIQETYSWVNMAGTGILGPDSCTYTTSLAAAGVVVSDPNYCPLLASSCWRKDDPTCPTSSDCEKVSGQCQPKGWSTTHLNAMKWMDEKLVSSSYTTSYDSCLALGQQGLRG